MMYKLKASLFTFLLVGTLGLVFLTMEAAHAACPDDIVSYWKLEEDADPYVDSINGNDGAESGVLTRTAGRIGNGQLFNGTNSEINVPADGSFGWGKDESFSIEFWIKRDGTVSGGNQVAVGRDDNFNNFTWWVGIEGGDVNVMRFILRDTNGSFLSAFSGLTDVTDNQWHHVVAIRDRNAGAAGQNLLYVDGALDIAAVDAAYNSGFDSVTADLNIGWLDSVTGFHFGGTLDEVALYNRALSLAEIQEHYNNGTGQDYCAGAGGGGTSLAPFPEETISYWRLDDDGTYPDSINGNDGTGNASPTFVPAGLVNGAQEFNATNTGIDVAADGSFGWGKDESFSIELWIKRDGTVSGLNQVAIGRDDNFNNFTWWVGIEGGDVNVMRFILRDTNGSFLSAFSGLTDVTDNQWHHVVAIRDRNAGAAGQNLLYVDGALDIAAVDAAYNSGFDSVTADLNIGWLDSVTGFHFGGTLDEVALYNRALTATEIQQHYNDGVKGWGIGYIPAAGFTANPISGVHPLIVNFTDQSTGNITSWSWDFGDGSTSTSTDQNPTYTYDNVGTYTVSLTVTGPYGTDAETKTAYIVVADTTPVANFTADPISGRRPLTVNFTDGSTGNITSWSWDFGDGLGTSTQQNPSYTYDVEGSYTVSLTVISPGGSDTETKTAYITVEKKKSSGGGGGCFIATTAR